MQIETSFHIHAEHPKQTSMANERRIDTVSTVMNSAEPAIPRNDGGQPACTQSS